MTGEPVTKPRFSIGRFLRTIAGTILILLGLLGFLPILGFWMIPLGFSILAVDSPYARRIYRRMKVAWGRMFQKLFHKRPESIQKRPESIHKRKE